LLPLLFLLRMDGADLVHLTELPTQPSSDHPAPDASIDSFMDALWLEDGLSPNTLAAYRRDLSLYSQWLHEAYSLKLPSTEEHHPQGSLAARASGKAPSANRRLTVFKRYFRSALREHLISRDPTLKLLTARQPVRIPKTMREAQVEALLAAPDADSP